MKKRGVSLSVARSTAWGSGICPSSQERATHRKPTPMNLYRHLQTLSMPHSKCGALCELKIVHIDIPWASTVALLRDWILKLPDFKRSRNKAHDKRLPKYIVAFINSPTARR